MSGVNWQLTPDFLHNPGMKLRLVFVLIVISAAGMSAHVPQGQGTDRVPAGFHEFEMFGDTAAFLSHYPMFGSVHAYQVLLEARVTGQGNNPWKLYLDYKKTHPAARFSVSPETPDGGDAYWPMPDVIKAGKTFRATIHTEPERGSPVFISRNVTVEITRIIHFRLFQPDDTKPAALRYLIFGNKSEVFAAHYLAAYPDFDQILAVSLDPAQSALVTGPAAAVLDFAGRANSKAQRLMPGTSAMRVQVKSLVHYEPDVMIQK